MNDLKWIWILLPFFCFTISCDKNDLNEEISVEKEIMHEMEKDRIPSVVACIVKDNKVVWEGNYGYADISTGKLAKQDTKYTLMSISKLFIAIAIMQLREDGLIDLDEDINAYLPFSVRNPHFPDDPISCRMLLTHTSGLAHPVAIDRIPHFEHFFAHEDVPSISEWIPEYILSDGTYYRPAVWKNHKPGATELYSNIGSSVLALILEELTDQDYRDYCQSNILQTLDMNDSGFSLTPIKIYATPYDDHDRPMEQYTYRHYPAGNLKSNAVDFSHFMIACLNEGQYGLKRILEPSSFRYMLDINNPNSGTALLWDHYHGGGIGHRGGGTGFSTMVELFPEQNTGFFIASNKVNGSVYPGGRIYELIRYELNKY
jgi:CubicO group peptidase (beta-lactamase class C family)